MSPVVITAHRGRTERLMFSLFSSLRLLKKSKVVHILRLNTHVAQKFTGTLLLYKLNAKKGVLHIWQKDFYYGC